jgi:hypothetical protein
VERAVLYSHPTKQGLKLQGTAVVGKAERQGGRKKSVPYAFFFAANEPARQ